ncbi:rod shape-determining protein MreC [Azohydromonas caseinilytica]|uniref:Cell shape-determining protein MreC n=1 Tax=Azohydromonas caseinilytica TaxID=2728836 RepID=A0A848F9N7_9BURK|nr:rod shape-determining protein MreC [Azohydromonas caseinilytica]NML16254.1 rod shape-determining protein MreC [Azohydromonas caseinilytica]
MALGTLDRTPPPFFRQGPSARTKLLFFSALALFLMVADTRFALVQPLRAVLATALLPVERTLLVPVTLVEEGYVYLQGLKTARAAEQDALARLAQQSLQAARTRQLETENAQLRALLELRPGITARSLAAEVLWQASDLYTRKLIIDRGAKQGVALGAPVVNEQGVLGQVTRLYPLSAEVTLLSDKDAAIPVINGRTQQRGAAFGGVNDALELRFMAANSDVQVGDPILTSGLDGVYPPGLAVASVERIDRQAEGGFARVTLKTAARMDGVHHVLVLEPMERQLPPRPEGLPDLPLSASASASAPASAPAGGGGRR